MNEPNVFRTKTRSTRTIALALVATLAIFALMLAVPRSDAEIDTRAAYRPVKTAAMNDPQIARGAYLVTIGACSDCHTPLRMGEKGPEPDVTRFLSGHPQDLKITANAVAPEGPWMMIAANTATAFSGPWGTSFAANLTPDEATGIGAWTEEIFMNALRTGRHWGQSREILPPMPWPYIGQMTDDDLKAVYAYLRTIPPIHNRIPEPLPPPGAEPETADMFGTEQSAEGD